MLVERVLAIGVAYFIHPANEDRKGKGVFAA